MTTTWIRWAGAAGAMACFVPAANAEVYRVRPDCGPGAVPDGLTWAGAFCGPDGLHDALAVSGPGDEVWLAAGTYRTAPPNGDRNTSFVLPAGVSVFGGFEGSEVSRDQRDPDAFVTRLSADLNDDDTHTENPYPGNANENAYHVIRFADAAEPSVLDGLTLQSGFAHGSASVMGDRGGNILVERSTLTVRDCTVAYGYASTVGGGIAAYDAELRIERCRFFANGCNDAGAGIAVIDDSHATIEDSVFEENIGGLGGGVYIGGANSVAPPKGIPSAVMRRCVVRGTRGLFGASAGGAIMVNMGDLLAERCEFIGNVADAGGAIYAISHDVKVVSCKFFGNTAPSDGGGAIFASGGSTTPGSAAPEFINCSFVRNNGVAMSNFDGDVHFTNCTMANNTIGFGFLSWPALSVEGGSALTLHNCIIWNNDTDDNPLFGEGPIALSTFGIPPVVEISGCIIEQWDGTIPGDAIDIDPLFVDIDGPDDALGTQDDDLRLSLGSPAVDAGQNGTVPSDAADLDGDGDTAEPTPLDLAGNPRFIDDPDANDTGQGTAPIVDIGALERACAADITGDGSLNFFDIAGFIDVYQAAQPQADWNGDGTINFFDIAGYISSYLAGCP